MTNVDIVVGRDEPPVNSSQVQQNSDIAGNGVEERKVQSATPVFGPAQSDGAHNNGDSSDGPTVENAPLLDVVELWASSASMHGTPYALNHHFHCWKQTIWWLVFFAALGLNIWQLTVLIKQYRTYAINVNTALAVPTSIPFPQVTVCNANSIQASKVDEQGSATPANAEELIAVSQSLDDFIRSTNFNFNSLDLNETWTPVITYQGLCWQFTAKESITRPGLEGGLQATFDLQSNEYLNDTDTAGLFIFALQEGEEVTSESPFILAPPGVFQYLAVTRQVIDRLTVTPWAKCQGTAPQYTQASCRASCYNDWLRKTCNCRGFDDVQSDLNFCAEFDDDNACASGVTDQNLEGCNGKCQQPPCHEVFYDMTSSNLGLVKTSDDDMVTAVDDVLAAQNKRLKDFIQIQINFNAIRQEEVSESKAISFNQLLSNIGGQLGLFLGLSVISIWELGGELFLFRIVPRLWGDRRLYGLGSRRPNEYAPGHLDI